MGEGSCMLRCNFGLKALGQNNKRWGLAKPVGRLPNKNPALLEFNVNKKPGLLELNLKINVFDCEPQ